MTAAELDNTPPAPTEKSREELLREGIAKMLSEKDANGGKEFTGSGLPDRRVLSKLVGWNVTAVEVGKAWEELGVVPIETPNESQ